MAGRHQYQTNHARLVALLLLLCIAAGVAPFSRSSSPSPSTPHNRELVQPNLIPDPSSPRLNRIHGRWEAVRASLGLLPLPHRVVFTPGPDSTLPGRPDKRASRFDLGRKRRADQAVRQLARLHFAHDTRPTQAGETEAVVAAPHHPPDNPNL